MEDIRSRIHQNQESIMNVLYDFEETRKSCHVKKIISEFFSLFFALAAVGGVYLFLIIRPDSTLINVLIWIFILALALGSACCYFFSDETRKKFESKLKRACYKKIMPALGSIKWHESNSSNSDEKSHVGLNDNILNKSGLFGDFNIRMIDDEFTGDYKGVDFKISETRLFNEVRSNKSRTRLTIFEGVVIQLISNKVAKNRTIVATKGDITKKNTFWILLVAFAPAIVNIIASCIDNKFQKPSDIICGIFIIAILIFIIVMRKSNEEPLNKVSLEDPSFNKRFDVYSSDQVEARYLLTPSFMTRLNDLTTAFGTKKIKCSFFDNDKFMLAISTKKDLFEIGKINKSLTNPKILEGFISEISAIYDIIDYLKFDEKTGI